MRATIARRALLGTGLAAGVGFAAPAPATYGSLSDGPDPLRRLQEGNRRWVTNRLAHRDGTDERRRRVAGQQHPFAVVFSCIDSRVPPEYVFDTDLGDLFVVRTAGQAWDPLVGGCLEYGPAHGTPLVMVLGHTGCGAVKATVEALEDHVGLPGHLPRVVAALTPAYHAAQREFRPHWDRTRRVEATIAAQVRLSVAQLRTDPVLRTGRVTGGIYDLRTGQVSFI